MYGLAVIEVMTMSEHLSNIDEMTISDYDITYTNYSFLQINIIYVDG